MRTDGLLILLLDWTRRLRKSTAKKVTVVQAMVLASLLELEQALPAEALALAVLVVQQVAPVEAATLAVVAMRLAEAEIMGVVATHAQAVETEEMELEDDQRAEPAGPVVADVPQAALEELAGVVDLLVGQAELVVQVVVLPEAPEEMVQADGPLPAVTLVLAVQDREEETEGSVFCVRKELRRELSR